MLMEHFHFQRWRPMTTAPYNRNLKLLALENAKTITVPSPCVRDNADRWTNSDLGTPIVIAPIAWQIWHQAQRVLPRVAASILR
jgi:hypothetical protein